MQIANILLPHAHLVPVGEDQLPRIELTRETARRFNREVKPIFPEPAALGGRVPRLVGTDGNAKMSKSRRNTIDLKDRAENVAKKVRNVYAGPPRGANEPGKVAAHLIFVSLDTFDHDVAQAQDLRQRDERRGVSHKELKDRSRAMLITAVLFWLFTYTDENQATGASQVTVREQLVVLKDPVVRRYSQYYSIVFGAMLLCCYG
jgi:tryptophanyl-tRNA synthetase